MVGALWVVGVRGAWAMDTTYLTVDPVWRWKLSECFAERFTKRMDDFGRWEEEEKLWDGECDGQDGGDEKLKIYDGRWA